MTKPITERTNSFDQWRMNTNIVSTNVGDTDGLYTTLGGGDSTPITKPTDTVAALNDLNTRKLNVTGGTVTGFAVSDGSIDFNSGDKVKFLSTTTATLTETLIVSVGASNAVRGGEITICMTKGTDYHLTKLWFVQDGTNVHSTETSIIITNAPLATFRIDVIGGNVNIYATPAFVASTKYEVGMMLLKV